MSITPISGKITVSGWTLAATLRLAAVIWACVAGSGCASLPDTAKFIDAASTNQPTLRIKSATGFLSADQNRALIDRLKKSAHPTDVLELQGAVLEAVSGSPPIKGNRVHLLIDGTATFAAMFRAIEGARFSINLETFIFEDDETGRKLADLLVQKAKEGVEINVLYDSVGAINTPVHFFEQLSSNGIRIMEFNPVNPLKDQDNHPVTIRNHRKILIVDGKVAITGGVNISKVYTTRFSGSYRKSKDGLPWRDTDVRIEGPAVAEFQKLFFSAWQEQKGLALSHDHYFPVLQDMGDDLVQVVASRPGELGRTTFIMYVSAITFAERTVHLTAAYFVPDTQMVDALMDAARRGVDVKIILPKTNDLSLALYAGRYYYGDLLEAGVKLYELRDSILHAKTAVVDGIWSTVGSTNLDFWSFSQNFEINAVILGGEFAAEMEQMFENDLEKSDRIIKKDWDNRSILSRIHELVAHLFAHML